jgi:hypothetical protein
MSAVSGRWTFLKLTANCLKKSLDTSPHLFIGIVWALMVIIWAEEED